MKYSRKRYDAVLRDALCIVYLKQIENTNQYDLSIITDTKDDPFISNYIVALQTIFANVWDRAKHNADQDASLIEICVKAIQLLDEIIKNM